MGGHTTKMHPGESIINRYKIDRRSERTQDRQVHAIAKAIHAAMKSGTLDAVTHSTFRWLRNRKTAAEREAAAQANKNDSASESVPADTRVRDKLADKGRVRRIKVKIWRIVVLPKKTREKLLGTEWKAVFSNVKPNLSFKRCE